MAYPFHDGTATVTYCGRICYKRRKINLIQVFAGQNVGVKQVADRIWLVSFMDYADRESVQPKSVTDVSGTDQNNLASPTGTNNMYGRLRGRLRRAA